MNAEKSQNLVFEDIKVSTKLKLAALWAGFMVVYIYLDYCHLYMPGSLQHISAGKAFAFDITQGFVLIMLSTASVPALMIYLSVALPAKISRCSNIIIAALYIPYTLFNLTGTVWMHMVLGAVAEVALLCLIIRHSWKWPRN